MTSTLHSCDETNYHGLRVTRVNRYPPCTKGRLRLNSLKVSLSVFFPPLTICRGMVHPPNTRTLYPTNTESSRKTLLIIGSTSRQGRAVIKELVYSPSTRHSFRILGLTRNPHSEPALSLLQITEVFRGSCITFVQADLNDPKSVEQIFQNNEIWGVFLVGVGKTAREEERHCTVGPITLVTNVL